MPKEVFGNLYALNQLPGGAYTVVDSDLGQAGTQPLGTAVTVRSPGDKALDTPGETFKVGQGAKAATYSYLGTMSDAAGQIIGMVGEKDGMRFLFTEHPGFQAGRALNLQAVSKTGATQWSLQQEGPLCFLAGTAIATPNGEVPVETLKPSDLVLTAEGRALPVRWLGRQTYCRVFGDPERILPIRIQAGALDGDLPRRDLSLSPDHGVGIDTLLVQAAALVNGTSVVRDDTVPISYTYYHIELPEHALVLAEGVAAESFIDNVDRMAFDNWAERGAIPQTTAPMTELPMPRVRSARQLPAVIRTRLAAIAARLGADRAAA